MKPEDLAYLKILRADCEKTLDLWCDKNSGKNAKQNYFDAKQKLKEFKIMQHKKGFFE
jgi:hypothetical protein